MARYHGDRTEAVVHGITSLLRPGDTFDVRDLATLLRDDLDTQDTNKVVYSLSLRSDNCLTRLSRGQYVFNGFGLDVVHGRLINRCRVHRGACPECFVQLPSSGVCDCGY